MPLWLRMGAALLTAALLLELLVVDRFALLLAAELETAALLAALLLAGLLDVLADVLPPPPQALRPAQSSRASTLWRVVIMVLLPRMFLV